MGQGQPGRCQEVGKSGQGQPVEIVIQVQQQQHIGPCGNDRIAGSQNIGRSLPNVAQQQAGAVAAKIGVKQRNPQRVGLCGQGKQDQQRGDQAAAKAFPSLSAKRRRLARIIRATRAMATPRITRLAGI